MKKLLIAAFVAAALPAFAHPPVHEKAEKQVHEMPQVEKANKMEKLNEGKVLREKFIEKTKINQL